MSATFRLMASGDLHWDEHRRFDECGRVHRWIAGEVARQEPDAFLIPGDIYERASTPVERASVAEWITSVAETCPVLIAKGNHDRHRDLELIGRLRTRHPVLVEERAGVHRIVSRDGRSTAAIGVVAWPDTAVLAAIMGRPLPSQALDDVAREALRNVLLGIGHQLSQHEGPRILMGHFMADGATTSVGQPLIGQALNVGLADLALSCADIVLMAHIHKPQEWQFGDVPVLYTGSPYRTTYGETEQKSVVLADLDGRRGVAWRRVPTPARAMHLVTGAWVAPQSGQVGEFTLDEAGQELLAGAAEGGATGAEVRVRYDVDADQQAAARPAAALIRDTLLAAGAADVKLEPVARPVVRAKAPEIARSTSLAEKMELFWASRGTAPEPARAARLLAKLGQVDSEIDRFDGVSGAVRLERLRFAGFRPYQEEVDIDVSRLPGQLVAVCGANGAGKSTLLELVAGALYREMPTHGSLADMATSRSAYVEATISSGARWTIRQSIDCETRGGKSLVTDPAGAPAFKGSGVTAYDAWAKRRVQPQQLFEATQFGAQRSGGFLDMGDVERKAVVLRALGIERYELLAKAAAEHAKTARSTVERLEGSLSTERARYGDVAAEQAKVDAADAAVAEAEAALVGARAELARAEAQVSAALAAARRQEETAAARRALAERLRVAREEHGTLVAHQQEGADLLAQASEIRCAERQLSDAATREAELRGARDLHEAAARAATHEATEARRRAQAADARRDAAVRRATEQREALARTLEQARDQAAGLERQIAADREGLVARAAEIRAAAKRLPEVVAQHGAAAAEVERLREAYRAATREADQHGVAASKGEGAARAAEVRAGRARTTAASLRALVTKAERDLGPARAALAAVEAELERRLAEVERLEGTRIAGADGRIGALRAALSEVAMPTAATAGRAPEDVASQALRDDTAAAELAATVPGQLTAARAALIEQRSARRDADHALGEIERSAERALEAAAAEEDVLAIEQEIAALIAAAAEERRLEAAARAEAERVAAEGKAAGRRAAALAEERDRLAPDAARAADLAGAEARIAGWQERLGQLRADAHHLAGELGGAPVDGGEEAARAEEEARTERAAADGADQRADTARRAAGAAAQALADLAIGRDRLLGIAALAADLGREETLAPARAEQIGQIADAIATIEREIGAIATEPPAPAAPDLAAPQAAVRVAEDAAREAHGAAGAARAGLVLAREGAARIAALAAEALAAEETISDWDRLTRDLGKDGLQAAEIDCVGPELSALANDLLHSCFSTRWTVTLRAARNSKDGSRELDGFEVLVLDSLDGREADARLFSPGQKALIGEAIANALSIVACRRAGVDGPTLFRDETSSGLDPESARAYLAMLRRVANAVGANKVFFISHSDEMKDLADARIEIVDGRIVSGATSAGAESCRQVTHLREVA